MSHNRWGYTNRRRRLAPARRQGSAPEPTRGVLVARPENFSSERRRTTAARSMRRGTDGKMPRSPAAREDPRNSVLAPVTGGNLGRKCSSPESTQQKTPLFWRAFRRAAEGTRTLDLLHGKQTIGLQFQQIRAIQNGSITLFLFRLLPFDAQSDAQKKSDAQLQNLMPNLDLWFRLAAWTSLTLSRPTWS